MAATQWTPILVLAVLRPALGRWGIGIAVFMLPVVMLITNSAVALAWGLWTTVIAKGSDGTFRYSAERTGREILYVPVPDEIKLKAKAWIDVGVEKGVGKASSALLLLLLVSIMDYRKVPFVAVGLSILGLVVAYRVRREYVQTLRKSIEGRFASLEGVYASIMGASTLPIIRQSLADPDPLKTAFALDLMDHAGVDDVRKVGPELHQLLSNRTPEIRLRVLGVLAMVPDAIDTEAVRGRLLDSDPRVREAAVRALAATTSDDPERVCSELLAMDDSRVRAATLACLATDMSAERAESVARPFFEARLGELAGADADHRLELALAAAVMRTHPDSGRLLARLFADPDGRVASAAMRSAGFHDNPEFADPLIDALGTPQTRFAAREALTALGQSVLAPLIARLNDERADARIRRNIPPVLAGIPSQETVGALIHSYELKETDQWLDNRSLRALTRLRRNDELVFEEEQVLKLLAREVETAGTYAEALAAAGTLETGSQSGRLLERALREARYDRRESSFRWLALLYPLQGMYRSYLALRSGDSRSRANALEWLESTVGHKVYAQLAPVVERPTEEASETADAWAALRKLWDDEDHWVARCAIWAMCDHRLNGVREELQAWQPEDPEWLTFKTRMLSRVDDDERAGERSIRKGNMDLIEKVFLLQSVDLLQEAGSAQLALMASIAEEVDSDTDEILIERGDPTDALYVVIRGEVELHGVGDQRLVVEDGSPFGTWALIDEEPSLVQARTTKPTRLLRIGRRDFDDLLADYPELGLDLLQGLARRVRTLVRS
jgi:HEAT repeat protein